MSSRELAPVVLAKKVQTGNQILEAGLQLFLVNGFDKTSMDAVAAAAGVSKTTLYAHHRDKLSLFRAAFEWGAADVDLRLDSRLTSHPREVEERLTGVLSAVLRATVSESSLALLRIMITESTRRPELVGIVRERGVPHVVAVVRSILEEDAAAHGYELPSPDEQALLVVRMAVASVQVDALCDATFRPEGRLIEAHAEWIAELFLRSLRSADRQGRLIAPGPAPDYGYPWVPGAPL